MNNFNDYYNYLNNNYNDMNFLADPNSMIYDMNYQALYPNAVMPKIGRASCRERV